MSEEKLDSRINYDKIAREKILTSYYMNGFYGRKMQETLDSECVESFNQGVEAKKFDEALMKVAK